MTQAIDQPEHLREAGEALKDCPEYAGHDVIPPEESQWDEWTIEIAVTANGVPANITRIIADSELTLRSAQPQGVGFNLVATA